MSASAGALMVELSIAEWIGFAMTILFGLSGWAAFFHERRLSGVHLHVSIASQGYGHTPERAKALFDLTVTNVGRHDAVLDSVELRVNGRETRFRSVPVEDVPSLEGFRLDVGARQAFKLRLESRPGFDPSHTSARLILKTRTGEKVSMPFMFGDHSTHTFRV